MNLTIILTIVLYGLSAAGYFHYLIVQKPYMHKSGLYLLLAGCACHTLVLAREILLSGYLPVHNLAANLSLAAWALVIAFLFLRRRYELRVLGLFTAALAALAMVIYPALPSHPAESKALFTSFWLAAHVLGMFIGEAALALACGAGILYLVQETSIKSKKRGYFYKRLPSLELLDNSGYTCIVFGFTFLTIGLVCGFVYARTVWGRFWAWDPKEVWSAMAWLLYAVLLHERLAVGWRGRRAAILAIAGFIVLLFTFLGVNFLMEGHHVKFTRW